MSAVPSPDTILAGIRLISWDVDGTLYHRGALVRALLWDAVCHPSRWPDLFRLRRRERVLDRARATALLSDAPPATVVSVADDERLDDWLVQAIRKLKPRRGAMRVLTAARALGLVQIVLSDFSAERKIAALGLTSYFAAFYTSRALGGLKPSPRPFVEIQRRHAVLPEEHLHVGDRDDTDGAGARAAGARLLIL